MKVLLDIKESKALFFMELLNSFSFVKAKPVTRDLLLQEINESTYTATEKETLAQKNIVQKDIFADVFGIWADRDIDAKTLRKQAWGHEYFY